MTIILHIKFTPVSFLSIPAFVPNRLITPLLVPHPYTPHTEMTRPCFCLLELAISILPLNWLPFRFAVSSSNAGTPAIICSLTLVFWLVWVGNCRKINRGCSSYLLVCVCVSQYNPQELCLSLLFKRDNHSSPSPCYLSDMPFRGTDAGLCGALEDY